MPFFKRAGKALAVGVCLLAVLILTHSIWLRWLGESLVDAGPPVKADAVLVLAGDWIGDRAEMGARLVKEGYAPIALISGPGYAYGLNEAALAIDFLVRRGYPREIFLPVVSSSFSTRDEAAVFGPLLRRRGVRRLVIVTSDFHTRRAGTLFRNGLAPDIEVHMVAVPDRHFTPDGWWKDREGQKTFFYEWSKSIASFFHI